MARKTEPQLRGSTLRFRIHPRALKALGAAWSRTMLSPSSSSSRTPTTHMRHESISDSRTDTGEPFVEVQDDGSGMDRKTIEDAWAIVATPYRLDHPVAFPSDGKTGERLARRVSDDFRPPGLAMS